MAPLLWLAANALLALLGTIGNGLLLVVVVVGRDGAVKKLLGHPFRSLVTMQALVDLIFSLVGIPLFMALAVEPQLSIGHVVAGCWLVELTGTRLILTSQWLLATLAAARLIATFWPNFFRLKMTGFGGSVLLNASALLLANGVFAVSVAAHWVLPGIGRGCCPKNTTDPIYYRLETLSYVALPIGIVCYLAIGWKLSRRRGVASGAEQLSERTSAARSTAVGRVRLLAVCFLVNLLLLAPQVIVWYGSQFVTHRPAPKWLRDMLQALFASASAANPLVYALVSADMRRAMWRLLKCR